MRNYIVSFDIGLGVLESILESQITDGSMLRTDISVKVERIIELYGDFESFEIVPYDSIGSILSGGRFPDHSKSVLLDIANRFNRNGISFNLALNGGNQYGDKIKFDPVVFKREIDVISELAKSGYEHGIENHLTIFRDELNDFVASEFPDLVRMASCIRYHTPDVGTDVERYQRDFDTYDLVVPANSHSSYDFLKQFPSEQMVLFYNQHCCSIKSERCHKDYLGVMEINLSHLDENVRKVKVEHEIIESGEPKSYIDSKIDFIPNYSRDPKNRACGNNPLMNRENEKRKFMASRVNKFKIGRGSEMTLDTMFYLAEEYKAVHSLLSKNLLPAN